MLFTKIFPLTFDDEAFYYIRSSYIKEAVMLKVIKCYIRMVYCFLKYISISSLKVGREGMFPTYFHHL